MPGSPLPGGYDSNLSIQLIVATALTPDELQQRYYQGE